MVEMTRTRSEDFIMIKLKASIGHNIKLDGVAPLIADPPPLKLHQ